MKYGLALIFWIFLLPFCYAQVTIDDQSFPQVGDTLYLGFDNLPNRINPLGGAASQRWDFSILQTPYVQEMIIMPANFYGEHIYFPKANAAVALNNKQIVFFNISDESILTVGTIGNDPLNLGYPKPVYYNPPLIERRAPLKYNEGYQSESYVSYQFALEEVNPKTFSSLTLKPDSIRIEITFDRQDFVDSWGTVVVPGGIFDVLKERRQEDRNISVYSKVSNFPWQDVTDEISATLFGNTRSIQYLFHSNEAINPIAILQMDQMDTEVKSVTFKPNLRNNIITSSDNQLPGIYAYPNPAIVNVRFEFSNLNPDNYKLKIFNILGIEVWSEEYYINGNRTTKVNVGNLKKGTYLYSLVDSKGKTISTKRLVVIKP